MSLRFTGLVMFTALVLLGPLPLEAADDGGARSILSYGAGSRGIGMGGAFGALTDDASAPTWNAAGLGYVTRPELLVTQTDYYGLGLNEQFASLAFPHWQFGTVSLSFRRFGASGIEARDSRNVLLSDDLANTESEFVIGYGRRLGAAWSVGMVVKARNHKIGDLSGSGIGLDLGVITRPLAMVDPNSPHAQRLSVGLSVRNAVTPDVRLVSESVSDPTGVRISAAYRLPIGARGLAAAVDIEKTAEMSTRFYSGVELYVHRLLTLRAGLNSDVYAAGAGVKWHGVSVDYALEQNEVDALHRFGVAFAFGATVDQRRQAALNARENELREQFEAAFEERQLLRVSELLFRASAEQREGRYEDALETLVAVEALQPDSDKARAIEVDCLVGLGREAETRGDFAAASVSYTRALAIDDANALARAGYERSQGESDRLARRSAEIQQLYAAALDAFAVGDLERAYAGFDAILKKSPSDRDAAAMRLRTQRAMQRRMSDLTADAERLIGWERFGDAERIIAHIRKADPRSPAIAPLEVALAEKREEAAARDAAAALVTTDPEDGDTTVTETTPVRVVTEEEKREAERLYKQALSAMSEQRSDDAIRYLELVWSIDPAYQRVSEHLKREYLRRGIEYFADGDLDKAAESWENVLRIDPKDPRAKGYLARAQERATRTREILGESQ